MGKKIYLLGLLLLSTTAFAGPDHVRVCDIWPVEGNLIHSDIWSCDGRILKAQNNSQHEVFLKALEDRSLLSVKVDEDFNVLKVAMAPLFVQDENNGELVRDDFDGSAFKLNSLLDDLFVLGEAALTSFVPTVLGTDQANELFNHMNPYAKKRSQCYQRAMVWTYEAYKKQGIKSQKAFIFFSRKYINNYKYKWWFHVAPLFVVSDDQSKNEMVLDYSFFNNPVTVRGWTDFFVAPKTECPRTDKYSDYVNNPNNRDCTLIVTPMHYYQPMHIEARDNGIMIEGFQSSHIDHAYKGFRLRGRQ